MIKQNAILQSYKIGAKFSHLKGIPLMTPDDATRFLDIESGITKLQKTILAVFNQTKERFAMLQASREHNPITEPSDPFSEVEPQAKKEPLAPRYEGLGDDWIKPDSDEDAQDEVD